MYSRGSSISSRRMKNRLRSLPLWSGPEPTGNSYALLKKIWLFNKSSHTHHHTHIITHNHESPLRNHGGKQQPFRLHWTLPWTSCSSSRPSYSAFSTAPTVSKLTTTYSPPLPTPSPAPPAAPWTDDGDSPSTPASSNSPVLWKMWKVWWPWNLQGNFQRIGFQNRAVNV